MQSWQIKSEKNYVPFQSGFSLIELLITMSLSLMFMLSVYKVFDVHKQGTELLAALNDREDNAQLAMKVIEDGIRMADHWGGVSYRDVALVAPRLSAYPGQCNVDWVFDVARGVFGLDGRANSSEINSLPSKCIANADYVGLSDMLALRFGDSRTLFYSKELDNKRYQKHYFLRAQSGKAAVIFQGRQSAQAVAMLPDKGLHYNMAFHSSLFFLRPCVSKLNGCDQGESVLTRLILKGDRYTQEALVEGVEHMQFEYGLDENKDAKVESYVSARAVTNWQAVLSVRMYLLVRSRLKDPTLDESGKVYVMNSQGSKTLDVYQVPEGRGSFPRKLYIKEIALRNRLIK